MQETPTAWRLGDGGGVKSLCRLFFLDGSFLGSAMASASQSGMKGTVPRNENDEVLDLAPILPRPVPALFLALIGLARAELDLDAESLLLLGWATTLELLEGGWGSVDLDGDALEERLGETTRETRDDEDDDSGASGRLEEEEARLDPDVPGVILRSMVGRDVLPLTLLSRFLGMRRTRGLDDFSSSSSKGSHATGAALSLFDIRRKGLGLGAAAGDSPSCVGKTLEAKSRSPS
mmetsp:Transcript_24968/g.48824  ORF Transcript_24968/g.48824 Transcript_24968/m.48824 type:complete len:234 (-) Transcript_24968:532-1233(-)